MKNVEPMQVLLLWKLLLSGGDQWLADILPKTISDNRVRRGLREDGYITEEKQKRQVVGKKTVSGTRVFLEDKGWAWVSENLDAKLPQSKAAADILQSLLPVIGQYLKQQDLVLVDLFTASENTDSVEEQILDICTALSSQGQRVKISDLYQKLSEIDLPTFHQILERMQTSGTLALAPLDNPREVTPEDKRCELTTSIGSKRHIVIVGN